MTKQARHSRSPAAVAVAIPVEQPTELAALPEAVSVDAQYEKAVERLEKVVRVGAKEPEIPYLLAMSYKRMGKWQQARQALHKIQTPDANVFQQLAILSLKENQLDQAEAELGHAWELDPSSFSIGWNLLMARLSLGHMGPAADLLSSLINLAPPEQCNLLQYLRVLSGLIPDEDGTTRGSRSDAQQQMTGITKEDVEQILTLIRSLGRIDSSHSLLKALISVIPNQPEVREAYFACTLVKARARMQRCNWTEAQTLLSPLVHQKNVHKRLRASLHNLLGCCACVTHDFDKAGHHFNNAIRALNDDARLYQNLAITYEFQDRIDAAAEKWDEVFETLTYGEMAEPEDILDYARALELAALRRLAYRYGDMDRWSTALSYLHRAHRIQPDDEDLVERLFQVHQQLDQKGNARKMLEKLRELRPYDPQIELYELDLIEVKGLPDIEYLLTEIETILNRYPDDPRVEDRAVAMVANVIPLMGNLCDQLTEQLNKVYRQMRNLPRYQIDWSALNEIMRDLARELRKLKRITTKCLPLVKAEEQQRVVRELQEHIEEKIEACRSLMD